MALGSKLQIARGTILAGIPAGRLVIGDDVSFARNCYVSPTQGHSLVIGKGTSFNSACHVDGAVTIGAQCLFSANIFISSSHHIFDVWPSLLIREQEQRREEAMALDPKLVDPVSVGEDCWVGWNAVILKGVRIGRGAVVAANAVVTKDVSPYSVVGGVPARVIRRRLEFQPPRSLRAEDSSSRPYFYEGFDVIGFPPATVGAMMASAGAPTVAVVLSGDTASAIEVELECGGNEVFRVSCNSAEVGHIEAGPGRHFATLPLGAVPVSTDAFFANMRVFTLGIVGKPSGHDWGVVTMRLV